MSGQGTKRDITSNYKRDITSNYKRDITSNAVQICTSAEWQCQVNEVENEHTSIMIVK